MKYFIYVSSDHLRLNNTFQLLNKCFNFARKSRRWHARIFIAIFYWKIFLKIYKITTALLFQRVKCWYWEFFFMETETSLGCKSWKIVTELKSLVFKLRRIICESKLNETHLSSSLITRLGQGGTIRWHGRLPRKLKLANSLCSRGSLACRKSQSQRQPLITEELDLLSIGQIRYGLN